MMHFSKKIYDSVHGFIRFNDWERELIDSPVFQRLHYVHQLGIAYLVYPGATHTRFEHSLGVMELATQIYDGILSKRLSQDVHQDKEYWKQIIRFAALCHDLGHLPFSHAAEKALLGKGGHESWTLEIIKSHLLKPLWKKVEMAYPGKDVPRDVIKMSIGEKNLGTIDTKGEYSFSPWERVLCQVICGDFFGADRIDYLLRDAQCTGVAYGLFDYHQLIEMLCILPIAKNKDAWELGIEENGVQSCEALLLARHFMHKRVYQYSSVKAYSFHISRFMERTYGKESFDLESYVSFSENEVLTAMNAASRDPTHPGYADALSLTSRERRFIAIEISESVQEGELQKMKEELKIPKESIAWDITEKKKVQIGLSFPVIKRNHEITNAKNCSEILIPMGSASWIYVDPEYETRVLDVPCLKKQLQHSGSYPC